MITARSRLRVPGVRREPNVLKAVDPFVNLHGQ
jgi:hypothetical protein